MFPHNCQYQEGVTLKCVELNKFGSSSLSKIKTVFIFVYLDHVLVNCSDSVLESGTLSLTQSNHLPI